MEDLVEALVNGDREWAQLAPPGIRARLQAMVGPNVPLHPMGVQMAAAQLRQAGEWLSAGHFAAALWSWMRRTGQLDDPRPPIPLMGANLVTFAAGALVDGGAPGPVLEQGRAWLAWLEQAGLSDAAGTLRLQLAEGAIENAALEDAARWLDEYAREFPAANEHPVYTRLRGVLDDLLRAVDQPDPPAPSLEEVLEKTLRILPPDMAPIVQQAAESARPFRPDGAMNPMGAVFTSAGFPPQIGNFDAAVQALDQIGSSGTPRFTINNVMEFLLHGLQELPREGEPQAYQALASLGLRAYRFATERGLWDTGLTIGWLAGICQRRRGDLDAAAQTLAELRAGVRSRQLGIANPRRRAALAVRLRHLTPVSAEGALARGAVRELFEIVEAGRGRILLDLLEAHAGRPLATDAGAFQQFLSTHEERVAYCSFLVDEDDGTGAGGGTYAVFVPQQGELVAARLPISRQILATAADELRRLNRGRPDARSFDDLGAIDPRAPFGRPYGAVLEALQPLARWWEALMDRGLLRDGDVLCLGLDGPLFNLPVQAVPVAGTPAGVRVGPSGVASAFALPLMAAARMRAGARRRPVAVVVPLASEDEARARRNLERLAQLGDVDLLGGPAVDLARVKAARLDGAFVHVAAHGIFESAHPLQGSGLLLARDGRYPPGQDARQGTLLTPNDLATLSLDGSHLTLRACVSGETTQVTSREALGMIWAAFQAGATSMLAGQWDIYIPSAADMLDHYYEAVASGQNVAGAYRVALDRVRRHSEAYSHPYHYCGLALYGYWR